ncbi:response regulator [Candidatus Poribacteria bacterium]|nr:response regulator [Candidatus Poribacteria bacterium]
MSEKIELLLVEDDPIDRDGLTAVLTRSGFDVTTAETGEEARQKMSEKMDVVVIDILLPTKTEYREEGIDLCREFKNKYPHIPIFIFTNLDMMPLVKQACMEAGAEEVIGKLTSGYELIERIKKILGKEEGGTKDE